MARTTLSRTVAAGLAGAALLLTAGSCEGEDGDDGEGGAGVVQQDDGDGDDD